MKDNSKSNSDDKSSADSVADYLQTLANKEGEREQLYYSQEQEFNSDELARVINETRLNELLMSYWCKVMSFCAVWVLRLRVLKINDLL